MSKTCSLLLAAALCAGYSVPASAVQALGSSFEGEDINASSLPEEATTSYRGTTNIFGPSVAALGLVRVVQFDLGGLASFDAIHIPGNIRFSLSLAAHERVSQIEIFVTGIDNDPGVGTDGGSWPSEARLTFHDDDEGEIYLDIPLYSSPAYDHNGTTDPPDLLTLFTEAELTHPGFHGPGNITLQLYETIDDAPGMADGIYRPGSYILITVVPEPASVMLLAAGLTCLLRRRMPAR